MPSDHLWVHLLHYKVIFSYVVIMQSYKALCQSSRPIKESVPPHRQNYSADKQYKTGGRNGWNMSCFLKQRIWKHNKTITNYMRSIHISFRNSGNVLYLAEGHWYMNYETRYSQTSLFQQICIENNGRVSRLDYNYQTTAKFGAKQR